MTKPSTTTGTRLSAAETTKSRKVALRLRLISIQVVAPNGHLKSLISEIS